MLSIAMVLLLAAALLHSWYSGNAVAKRGRAAVGFYSFGPLVLIAAILMLLCSLGIILFTAGILAALGAAGLYFFVMPLILMPILERLGFIPGSADRLTKEERKLQDHLRDLMR